ncbi:hypothetical protein TNIN_60141 [Trichonephila inaurata madagascariensis]|uniref:Uncharacterized protein n=1 Tax=Trichonephila inaurata madagascariensis TaxID=2747483 RepID=A0A8X6YLX5_9ARAC|nr:hypothetical protein TNIN_60141 [Trichonephila inaurata madagascariensis]
MLHEQELLCENLPVKTSCEDKPESIRNHMAILEEMLSDSNDLFIFFHAPISDLDTFLSIAIKWMHGCVHVHNKLKDIYLCSSCRVRMLDIVRLSVTIEERNKMNNEYKHRQIIHDAVKKLIYKIKLLNQRRLEEILRCSLELCDAINMVNVLVDLVNVFSWFPTVSEKYVQFTHTHIKADEKHLLSYARKVIALKTEQQ